MIGIVQGGTVVDVRLLNVKVHERAARRIGLTWLIPLSDRTSAFLSHVSHTSITRDKKIIQLKLHHDLP